jgi:hypothetical protein
MQAVPKLNSRMLTISTYQALLIDLASKSGAELQFSLLLVFLLPCYEVVAAISSKGQQSVLLFLLIGSAHRIITII